MRALALLLLASCVVVHVSAPPRAPREQPPIAATDALLDLEIAASAGHGATCTPYPWSPLADAIQECR